MEVCGYVCVCVDLPMYVCAFNLYAKHVWRVMDVYVYVHVYVCTYVWYVCMYAFNLFAGNGKYVCMYACI